MTAPLTAAVLRARLVAVALAQLGITDPRAYYRDTCGPHTWNWPAHWCQLFCLWCLHQLGMALTWAWVEEHDGEWRLTGGFLRYLPTVQNPELGDFAYWKKHQSAAVVVKVDREKRTVDVVKGNGGTKGKVKLYTKSFDEIAAFYSIAPLLAVQLLDGEVESAAPEPALEPAPVLRVGSYGPEVEEWKAFLYSNAEADWFDVYDEAATKVYQRRVGLQPDGVVGPKTRKAAGLD